jgi:hypothetical protein
VALFNGVLLLTIWAFFERNGVRADGIVLLRGAALLSVGIFFVQGLYLFGLAKTAPFLSAVLLSAGVPISIFGDLLFGKGPSHPLLSLWLSLGFSLATGLINWATSGRAGKQLTTGLPLEVE